MCSILGYRVRSAGWKVAFAADGLLVVCLSVSHGDGLTGIGALHCGEAEFEATEVPGCVVARFAILFDGAEKLAHGTLKARLEPASLQGNATLA